MARTPEAPELIRLMHSLQGLAADADDQLAITPSWVMQVDELALDFGNWKEACRGLSPFPFDVDQSRALSAVDGALEAVQDWSTEGLRARSEWVSIRALARTALDALDWPQEPPPSSPDHFARGGR